MSSRYDLIKVIFTKKQKPPFVEVFVFSICNTHSQIGTVELLKNLHRFSKIQPISIHPPFLANHGSHWN